MPSDAPSHLHGLWVDVDADARPLPDVSSARDRIADAYAGMLGGFNAHWFLTLTFRPKHESASGGIHPEKADKAFRVLLSKVNRHIYGPRWHKRPDGGIAWARGQEFHKSGRIHFHAIASAPTADLNTLARRMDWVDWWWREFGIARIEKPLSREDVARYVSKYVMKDGEIDFSPNFGRYVPPALDFRDAAPSKPTRYTSTPSAVAKHAEGSINGLREDSRCLTLQKRLAPAYFQLPDHEETSQ